MGGATLFSIPIYSSSEKKYNSDYKKYIKRHASLLIDAFLDCGKSEEEAIQKTEKYLSHKRIWKYNQIIGYLEINVNGSIDFDYCLFDEKKVMKFTNKRRWFSSIQPAINYHVSLQGTNKEIGKQVLDEVKCIAENNKWILDLSSFELIYEDIDYLKFKNWWKK